MKISELSKEELLGLIYTRLPNTLYDLHPVYCVVCEKGYVGRKVVVVGREVEPYAIICDDCNK